MWGCVGWRAIVAHTRDPATPRCAPGPAAPIWALAVGLPGGSGCTREPYWGVSLLPLQCWSISDPTSLLATSPAALLPHRSTGRSYWSVLRVGAGQDGQWICTRCPFLPGHLSSAAHRKGMGQRGFSFHPALSSQPLFSEKKPTPWLAVSKTTAFWGNAAPLYPWTSWAGGKMSSISMCGNSPLLHCVTLQPRKARLGLSPAVLADDFVWFTWREAHRDMQGPGMCHVSLVHPWALAQPSTAQQCLLLAGVECVLFNEEYMTCMWGSRETLTVNYSLYYR